MNECKPLKIGSIGADGDADAAPPTLAWKLRHTCVFQSDIVGRGLHSSTFQLNLSRFGYTFPCPPV